MALQLASGPAAAQGPPPYGDWTVANETVTYSSAAVLYGDLTVDKGGVLNLNGARIIFDGAEKGHYTLEVRSGGTLLATDTSFSAKDLNLTFNFKMMTGSNVVLDHCTISGVGAFLSTMDDWGMYVHSSNATITRCTITKCNVGIMVNGKVSPTISYNNITGNHDRGIWCRYSTPYLIGNRLSGNSYGLYLENESFPVVQNNEFADNGRDAVFMAPGSRAEWVMTAPCSWVNSTAVVRGNISIGAGGALRLQNSGLTMASARSGISVASGGQLKLWGSTLAAPDAGGAYYLDVAAGGNLSVEGSRIRNAGWDGEGPARSGIYIAGQGWVIGSDLSGNWASLMCDRASVTAVNSTLGGAWLDLWADNSTVRFVNVSTYPSKALLLGQSSLEVCWYLSAGAVWQNGKGISGARLSVRYAGGAAIYDGDPGDGWARWLVVTQKKVTATLTTDTANISLSAGLSGFDDVTRTVQALSNREERLVFTDQSPPELNITSPPEGFATNQSRLQVAGSVSDRFLVGLDYSIDDSPRWTPVPADPHGLGPWPVSGPWGLTLTNLTRGHHRLSVRAQDESGLVSDAHLDYTVDFEQPKLELDLPFDESILVNGSGVRFKGATDAGSRLLVGDTEVLVADDGTFDSVLNFSEGEHLLRIIAQDKAGNIAFVQRRITVDITPPRILIFSPPDGFKTKKAEVQLEGRIEPGAKFRIDGSTIGLLPDGGFNQTILLFGGPKVLELYAEDSAGNGNTTNWTIDRQLESDLGEGFWARNMPMMAAGAIVAAIVIVGAALVVRRRRHMGSARAVRPPVAAPTDRPCAVEGEGASADEVLYVDDTSSEK